MDGSDEALMDRYRVSRDIEALHELFSRYKHQLPNYLRGTLKLDREIVEDACQETWLKLMKHPEQWKTGCSGNFRGWIRLIARRCAIDLIRTARRRIQMPMPGPAPPIFDMLAFGKLIHALLSQLDERSRQVFTRRYFTSPSDELLMLPSSAVLDHLREEKPLPYQKISEELDISISAAHQINVKCLKLAKRLLEDL